jgi:hypothetical protein
LFVTQANMELIKYVFISLVLAPSREAIRIAPSKPCSRGDKVA